MLVVGQCTIVKICRLVKTLGEPLIFVSVGAVFFLGAMGSTGVTVVVGLEIVFECEFFDNGGRYLHERFRMNVHHGGRLKAYSLLLTERFHLEVGWSNGLEGAPWSIGLNNL